MEKDDEVIGGATITVSAEVLIAAGVITTAAVWHYVETGEPIDLSAMSKELQYETMRSISNAQANIEALNDTAIGLWNSTLVLANGQKDTNLEGEVLPAPLQRRVKLRKGTKQEVIDNTDVIVDEEGKLRLLDPYGNPLPGNRVSKRRNEDGVLEDVYGDYDFGHIEDWADYRNDKRNWEKTSN